MTPRRLVVDEGDDHVRARLDEGILKFNEATTGTTDGRMRTVRELDADPVLVGAATGRAFGGHVDVVRVP